MAPVTLPDNPRELNLPHDSWRVGQKETVQWKLWRLGNTITLYLGDCLDVMPRLAGPFDMILADLPYGTTACKWDTVIPFEPLWEQYKRLIKPRGAIVLFGSQPFTSALVMSNIEWFKYEWVWEKTRPGDLFNAKNSPLKAHENILVFSDGTVANRSQCRMPYYPQGLRRINRKWKRPQKYYSDLKMARPSHKLERTLQYTNYPRSILKFANPNNDVIHPTQKPVDLLEYLIRTYTNEGETVLDNVMGSGSTGVACVNTNRRFVGIELLPEYYEIAQQRIEQAWAQPRQKELFS